MVLGIVFSYTIPFFIMNLPQPITINALLKKLELKLNGELIGEEAHLKMVPHGRDMHPKQGSTPRKSAVLISFYSCNNEVYFPLIKRAAYDGTHGGQMALPGGKLEKTDKDLIHTAIRETEEEIGIDQTDVKVLGVLSEIYISVSNISILPVVAYINYEPSYKPDPSEVEQVHSVKLSELLNPENKYCEEWEIRGDKMDVPFYKLDDKKVWGATAMILSELELLLLN